MTIFHYGGNCGKKQKRDYFLPKFSIWIFFVSPLNDHGDMNIQSISKILAKNSILFFLLFGTVTSIVKDSHLRWSINHFFCLRHTHTHTRTHARKEHRKRERESERETHTHRDTHAHTQSEPFLTIDLLSFPAFVKMCAPTEGSLIEQKIQIHQANISFNEGKNREIK